MRKSGLKVGDQVILQLGVEGNRLAPKGLKRWDECRFTVSAVKSICGKKGFAYYELKACKSPHGIPYAIPEDWLLPLR